MSRPTVFAIVGNHPSFASSLPSAQVPNDPMEEARRRLIGGDAPAQSSPTPAKLLLPEGNSLSRVRPSVPGASPGSKAAVPFLLLRAGGCDKCIRKFSTADLCWSVA
ncbi:MAG: hypothetical protein WA815_04415, partial [Terracidiphilus sp.]